jgi:Tfp pilus assembly protein PilX
MHCTLSTSKGMDAVVNCINKKQKGSAMIIAMILTMIVVTLSSVLLFSVLSEIQMNTAMEQKAMATYLAQAGIEQGLCILENPASQYPSLVQDVKIIDQPNNVHKYHINPISKIIDASGNTSSTIQSQGSVILNGATVNQITIKVTVTITSAGSISITTVPVP